MKISTLIALMGVIGALMAALVTFVQMDSVSGYQTRAYNAINTQLYSSSWTGKSEQSWNRYLDRFNPDGFSEEYDGVFTPESEVSAQRGVIYNSILSGSYAEAAAALQEYFFFELEDQRLSFVVVYDLAGEQIYCGYARDFSRGVDPCSDSVSADFQDDFMGFLRETNQAKRTIVRLDDLQGTKTSTFNQTLIFPIKDGKDNPIAVSIIGRNLFSDLELFEQEYNVRAAISATDLDVSMESYGLVEQNDFKVSMEELVNRAKELLTEKTRSETIGDAVTRYTITRLPIGPYSPENAGELLIFTNQDEIYAALHEAQQTIYLLWGCLIIAIAAALAWFTTHAFKGILRSVDVLNQLTEQQKTNQQFEEIEMPNNSGAISMLTSANSEVPRLIEALGHYKDALVVNRNVSRDNLSRRLERDELIAEKMRVLADQLEGDAREDMLKDVARLQAWDKEETEEKRESRSVEFMSSAFSKITDEVSKLIEMRTEARDEAREQKEQTGRFFNNMSHELRTPLNAIIGYSEMLYEDCEDEGYEELMVDLKRITNSGKHLLELVNEILDIGKIQAGKMDFFPANFDLAETIDMVRDISSPLADKNGNSFVIDLPKTVSTNMFTDEGKLRQNLTNLLSNAFKFTENGEVKLSISETEIEGVDMVVFKISDTGKGMTPEFLETIFDEYSQQAGTSTSNIPEMQKSTGLGMAILAKYVEMGGGTVQVRSELGRGSTFTMNMPRRYEDAHHNEENLNELSKALRLLKPDSFVVMIDDDPNMHDLAKRTLRKAGIDLIGAMDGETGLNIIRANRPSLILLDVYMPGREGWSILSEIKADPDLKEIPVCMVTQLNEQDYAESLGANGYITKPIDRERFVTEILKLLNTNEIANQSILVIDDDTNTRDLLNKILLEEGFDPQTAADGIDGLEKLDELTMQGLGPSLIVLDILMPRMDGFQFLDAYSAKVPLENRVPIIIFSGKDMTQTQREMLNNFENVIGVFTKGDLPNLTSFIQEHQEGEENDEVETKFI